MDNKEYFILMYICCIAEVTSYTKKKTKYNVVFIIVDDLRQLTDESVYLPNIQIMAERGINFKYAYAQQAQCLPSRISLFTGRRPDSLRLYDSYSYHTTPARKFTTLPQLFKARGYNTYAVGKVFDMDEKLCNNHCPHIWSKPHYHPPSIKYEDTVVCGIYKSKIQKKNLICPVVVAKQPNQTLPDLEILNEGIRILKENKNTKPFFLAIGFQKPHIPLKFPKKYLETIPLANIKPPISLSKPTKMPLVAWHPWMDIRNRDDIQQLHILFPMGVMPEKWILKIRQSYYAAALFIDDLIGELLVHINRKNTITVVTSDHGFSLGENGLWSKYSNFDVALRVPLIFDIPGMKSKSINMPVELIDLFPTLTALTGLDKNIPRCKHNDRKSKLCFDGKSLVPLMQLEKNKFTGQPFAFSQNPRPSVKPWGNTCKPTPKEINIMGYSVRTDRYRYTEWVSFNNKTFQRNWSIIYGYELYDHVDDPEESNNVYFDNDYKKLAQMLSNLLRSHVERGIYSFNDL